MRIVAFDLETTNLSALMGRVLCASFLPITNEGSEQGAYTFRSDKSPWKQKDRICDRSLVTAIRNELERYHLVVGWNSKLFDVPLLNARLLKFNERPFRAHLHLDAMWYAGGGSLRIGSKKLINVQKYFNLAQEKTEISWEQWQRAASGDRPAMDEVVTHCEQDVKVLELAYWQLLPMVANIHR